MRLIAVKDIGFPLYKKKGDLFEMSDGYAKTYILMGVAQRAKREYKRRDMKAEDVQTVTITTDDE